jgi:Ca2+-transporting ATPase
MWTMRRLPADRQVLDRPPRRPDQRLLDAHRWLELSARGAVLAGAALVAVTVGAAALDLGDGAARTFALLVLVVAHLLYALVLADFPRRGWLPIAVLGGLGLHVAAMLTPAGRSVLGLTALPPVAWLAAAALASAPIALLTARIRLPGAGAAGAVPSRPRRPRRVRQGPKVPR